MSLPVEIDQLKLVSIFTDRLFRFFLPRYIPGDFGGADDNPFEFLIGETVREIWISLPDLPNRIV